MTSYRQIEANRGCNVVRHGLTAETVIGALEDAEDYKAFKAAMTTDYTHLAIAGGQVAFRSDLNLPTD